MGSPIAKRNVLLEGTAPLTVKQKEMFEYFGVGSKIKPPYRILNPHHIHVGDRTSIQEYSHINAFSDLSFLMDYIEPKFKKAFKAADYLYDSKVHIDRECQIGRFFFISCTARIRIHPNVVISERVFVGDNHHTFFHPNVPIMQQPNQQGEPVEIKKGAWIGVGVAVLKGTSLGMNSVVGANSVVQGIFPDHAIIAAPRAQLITTRKENDPC
jgi:acetyltransferase-like isoleucine patch superfamily enzyme